MIINKINIIRKMEIEDQLEMLVVKLPPLNPISS